MKYTFILLTITSFAFGQHTDANHRCKKQLDTLSNREIYDTVDTPATVGGGLGKLYSEIGKIKIPNDPETDRISIIVSFIVEPNGDITSLRTVGKITSATLDKELLELFKKQKWVAGTCQGRKVASRLVLSVKS